MSPWAVGFVPRQAPPVPPTAPSGGHRPRSLEYNPLWIRGAVSPATLGGVRISPTNVYPSCAPNPELPPEFGAARTTDKRLFVRQHSEPLAPLPAYQNCKMSSDPVPLAEKVKSWAEREGFPLEMRLRKQFTDAGFALAQAAFVDSTTDKYRAGADIVAHKSTVLSMKGGGQLRVYAFAVVECKLGGSKPWVAFLHSHGGHGITMVQQLTSVQEDRSTIERLTHPQRRKEL
jgi:hypothetical protein